MVHKHVIYVFQKHTMNISFPYYYNLHRSTDMLVFILSDLTLHIRSPSNFNSPAFQNLIYIIVLSIFKNIIQIMNLIEEACTKIVCPPKFKYSVFDLGSMILENGRRYDFNVRNRNNLLLQCSLFVPNKSDNSFLSKTTIVYLHSMNGSRLQSLTYVSQLLKIGISLCSFDFSGCGNSQGSRISFGSNQKFDVETVLRELMEKFNKERFILWGRSMGAVACVKFVEMMNQKYLGFDILAMILDSPFKSFKQLIIEIGAKKSELPQFLVHAGYFFIKKTLQEKGQFQMQDLQLINSVKSIHDVSTLFLVSKEDTTVNSNHSEQLFAEHSCVDKQLLFINGLHNQSRDELYLKYVKNYIGCILKQKQKYPINTKRKQRYRKLALQQIQLRKGQRSRSQQISQNCGCSIFQRNQVKSPSNFLRKR